MGGLSPIHDDNDAAYDLMIDGQYQPREGLMRFGDGLLEDLLLHDIHEEGAGGSGGEVLISARVSELDSNSPSTCISF